MERAIYAFYLAIAISMALMLLVAIASADAVGILPTEAFSLLGSPSVMLGTYALAFLLAPFAAERYPLRRK